MLWGNQKPNFPPLYFRNPINPDLEAPGALKSCTDPIPTQQNLQERDNESSLCSPATLQRQLPPRTISTKIQQRISDVDLYPWGAGPQSTNKWLPHYHKTAFNPQDGDLGSERMLEMIFPADRSKRGGKKARLITAHKTAIKPRAGKHA